MNNSYWKLLPGAAALLASAQMASSTTLVAVGDTIMLQNAGPSNSDAGSGDAEDNFGGRTEVIIGNNGSNPRHGLFRFDVSSLAAEINGPQTLSSATFTLYERAGRDANNGSLSATFAIYGLVAGNTGWVEGTTAGSSGGYSADPGTVAYSYHSAPSVFQATDGQRWVSQGGGATEASGLPSPSTFQFGTDTGASLGSGLFQAAGGVADTLVITLDAAALEALLPTWLADGATNAGLAIESAGSSQLFFESIEGDAEAVGGVTAATLDLVFVPEPSTTGLLMLGGLLALRRRR